VTIDEMVDQLSYAIAIAEGYFATDSLPSRINNPGDLELGDKGHGVEAGKTVYATAEDGWAALKRECKMILTGTSRVYNVSDTMEQMAHKWTGGDNPGAWCKIVMEKLGVDPMTTIADWIRAKGGTDGGSDTNAISA
jgi:hypothetical protein